jgi:calcium-translocating P-type ATPase
MAKEEQNQDWYISDIQSVLECLQVQPDKGLSKDMIPQRQERAGKNILQPPKKSGLFGKILHQLKDVSVIVLLIAVALSFLLAIKEGEGFIEPLVILAVVILNLFLAITQEGKAEKALDALEKMNAPDCIVLRDGVRQSIETSELVPGDVIILETGSIIPADARLIESAGLFSDESALTGESEPAGKDALAVLSDNVPLGDQCNMVFTGCVVTAGRGAAVVTTTGMDTQMGKIAGYLHDVKKEKTPLQKRLDGLGKTICWIAIVSAFFLLAVGLRSGTEFGTMLMIAVALAVAAVPETLSLIVTLSLTNGVQKMVKKNALIRKLPAVETLGSASVICSDKTGTLTQNRMTIKRLWMRGGEPFADDDKFNENQIRFLEMLVEAGNATMETDEAGNIKYIGSATAIAMLRLLNDKGYTFGNAAEDYPRVGEIPFSSERKKSSVILQDTKEGGYIILTMGALDRLPICPDSAADLEAAQRIHDQFAEKALRVIALAGKRVAELPDCGNLEKLEWNIKLIGLVGLIDPPRPEAAEAIATAKNAGIRTVMITGDHASTAKAIAKELGILQEGQNVMTGARLAEISDVELNDTVRNFAVYARVSPEDKIRIVKAWQENGEVVAMTGDGVNDAPALKAADIGVAMGKAGTEVAKGASDMVLTDDNFATIVEAVNEGRNVYGIVKKVIYFLLVCNLSEIVIMIFGQMAGWGLVLTPVMLLLINILGDGIPGINLAKEPSDPGLMNNKPINRNESFFTPDLVRRILRQTIFCSIVVLIGYYIGAFMNVSDTVLPSAKIGQTMAFLICGWTSIIHIFHVRSSKSVFKTSIRNNKPLASSAAIMILVFGLMAAFPVGEIFGLSLISGIHWLAVAGLSLVPTIAREIGRLIDDSIQNQVMKRYQVINEHYRRVIGYRDRGKAFIRDKFYNRMNN